MKLKKGLSFLLAAAMSLSLTACGKGEADTENKNAEEASKYTYVANFLGSIPENCNGITFFDGKAYTTEYNWDEETGISETNLIPVAVDDTGVKESDTKITLGGDSRDVSGIGVYDGGKVKTVEIVRPESDQDLSSDQAYQEYLKSFQYYICDYSETGEKLSEIDITAALQKDSVSYVNSFFVDGEGNTAVITDQTVYYVNQDGQLSGKSDCGNWIDQTGFGKSGAAYVSYYDDASNGYLLSQIDFQAKSVVPTKAKIAYVRAIGKGINEELLCIDDAGKLVDVDTESGDIQEICSLLDCDINADNVRAVSSTEDGTILLYINDYEQGIYELKKVETASLTEKEKLTIATLYNDSALNDLVVNFNKQSDKYKIKVINFIDSNTEWTETTYQDAITNLQNDLVNYTSGIDLLCMNDNIVFERLKSKGVLEDLTPYIDKSEKISKDSYFDKVLEASTYEGKLISLARGFSLQSCVGKKEVLGDREGWTLKDVEELSKRYPDSQLFNYASKQSTLNSMLSLTWTEFMDEENGTCSFDQENFKSILNICKSYPDEVEWSENDKGTAAKLADNEILLNEAYLSGFEDIQSATAYFGDIPTTFVGYPTKDGSAGTIISLTNSYSMTTKSQHKDGAWDFLEYVAAKPYDSWQDDYVFPTIKSEFEKKRDEATTVEYVKDENGEFVLDDEGNKIEVGGGGSMWSDSDGWTYTFHKTTKEEVAILETLLEKSIPSTYTFNETIMNIIIEEADPFFKGQKSVDDVCSIIQSRINIYMKENM